MPQSEYVLRHDDVGAFLDHVATRAGAIFLDSIGAMLPASICKDLARIFSVQEFFGPVVRDQIHCFLTERPRRERSTRELIEEARHSVSAATWKPLSPIVAIRRALALCAFVVAELLLGNTPD